MQINEKDNFPVHTLWDYLQSLLEKYSYLCNTSLYKIYLIFIKQEFSVSLKTSYESQKLNFFISLENLEDP